MPKPPAAHAPAKRLMRAKAVSTVKPEREPRGARRKRETREKLVESAFRLMAVRGASGVTINEITEEADVGIGSFYNHFDSKEAIHDAVVKEVFEGFADAMDALERGLKDPAEIIAVSVRHTLLRARREPLWGRFLLREGFSTEAMTRGLGARLLRDIQAGLVSGRFKVPDPMMSFVAVGSSVLGAIAAQLQVLDGASVLAAQAADVEHIPERAAEVALHGLGLSFKEAHGVARRALPVVEATSPMPSLS